MADKDYNIAVHITGDTKQAQGAVDKLKTSLGGKGGLGEVAKGAFTGFLAAQAAAMSIGTLTSAVSDMISGAMEAEAIQADLNAVLKSTAGVSGMTADSINELASEIQAVTKFEDDAVVEGQAMLLTFTKIGQDVFPDATRAMTDMAQKFGYDLPQAAVTLGKALNDPITGVTALRRIGVQLTDAQEDQIKAFVEVGDVASAQKIILSELDTEIGGVAEAYGKTTPGQMAIFQNKLDGIKDSIGKGFLPTITELTGKLGKLTDAFGGSSDGLTTLTAAGVQFMATPLGNVLDQAAKNAELLSKAGNAALSVLNLLGIKTDENSAAANAATGAWEKFSSVISTIAGGPMAWLTAAIDAVGNAIRTVQSLSMTQIIADFQRLGVDISGVGASAAAFQASLSTALNNIRNNIASLTGKTIGQLRASVDGLIKMAQPFGKNFQAAISAIGKSVNSLIGGPLNALRTALAKIDSALQHIRSLNLNKILEKAHELNIPGFATGGVVPGPIGTPTLAVVHGGETITPPGETINRTTVSQQGQRVYIQTLNLNGVQNVQKVLREFEALGV